MVRFFGVVLFVLFLKCSADTVDLTPEAITVYRNPEFFKNLNYGAKINYNQKPVKTPQATTGSSRKYKYPGETKKSNPPLDSPGFEINYDNSPEFQHEPRDIFIDTTYKPTRKKGPYSPEYSEEHTTEGQKPVREKESEEEEGKESKENLENDSGEEPRDFVSEFSKNSDEEFRSYHEPILLARPTFDTVSSSGYNKPYPYNRSSPVLYEDWKFYTYPKIHANEHLKSDSKIYSEEPSSNSFEDESSHSYYETDDVSNFFEDDEFKNLGADTKHIYKKLLKPNKSFLFKFHSKPKLKKLKFKLRKKHLHNTDWFNEYPFNF